LSVGGTVTSRPARCSNGEVLCSNAVVCDDLPVVVNSLLGMSAALWVVTFAVGSADALYYHLIKLRLYERPESRMEHVAHGIRALLLPPTIWIAFAATSFSPSARLSTLIIFIATDWLLAAR
jgi:hypothetical protein